MWGGATSGGAVASGGAVSGIGGGAGGGSTVGGGMHSSATNTASHLDNQNMAAFSDYDATHTLMALLERRMPERRAAESGRKSRVRPPPFEWRTPACDA